MIEAIQAKKEQALHETPARETPARETRLPRGDSNGPAGGNRPSMGKEPRKSSGDGQSGAGKPAKKPSRSKDKKSYQLRPGESLRKGVKRIVRGQLKKTRAGRSAGFW